MTFEERVQAQRAIERIYYSHLTDARVPFEQKVTQALLERKVHAYLGQSAALEGFWHTPVTAEMLRAETERIARNSRFPERLAEIHAALNQDNFLVQETLVRASLVDRLSRNFLASDPRVQGAARAEIDILRQQLLEGIVSAGSAHVSRSTLEAVASTENEDVTATPTPAMAPRLGSSPGSVRMDVSLREMRRLRASVGAAPGDVGPVIGPVTEEQGAYLVKVLVAPEPGVARITTYTVPKTSWDEWWSSHRTDFDETNVTEVADGAGTSLGYLVSGGTASSCGPDDVWSNGALDDVPVGRFLHTAVWTGTYMIVWGGIPPEIGGRYDPLTDTWQGISTDGDASDALLPTAVWTGQEMIVWGDSPLGTPLGARYDPVADRWSPVSGIGAPSTRRGQTAVWTGREMLIWGGRENQSGSNTNTGAAYDPSADIWRPMSLFGAPDARVGHTAIWTGQEMIVWGGGVDLPPPLQGPSGNWLGSGSKYNPAADSWTPVAMTNAPTPRVNHTAIWTGTQMIVWGGLTVQASFPSITATGTGARYDPATDTWTPTSQVGTPGSRRAHTAIWTGSRMIVWGGTSDPLHPPRWNSDRQGGIYDPVSNAWQPTKLDDPVSSRAYHTAVWSGTLMLVWGGQHYEGRDFTESMGRRYDPATDSWTPISETSQGVAVSNRTPIVWTGTEMIAWGFGGGRYDPMTDVWTATSSQNAPLPRQDHVAVWTGDEMVVWGGTADFLSYFNSGGRYDPITDSWTPTSQIAAPAGRGGARAIWTGKEMLFWGGALDFGVPLSPAQRVGGRYDPSTDTWRALPLLNAPPVTFNHTAVWTGQEMIVWGGYKADCTVTFCGTPATNTGARYNPGLDAWTPLPLPPVTGSYSHTATWTGHEMIVIGGRGSPFFGHLPLIYDLASDSWSTVNIPSDLVNLMTVSSHTAVWTGRHLLLWGGDFSGVYVDYDRLANAWSPMSVEDSPTFRSGHNALWTGSSMLVWGGYGSTSPPLPRYSGGRYFFGQHSDDDGDGYSRCQGDCHDTDASAYPGAAETCNARDDDCDGMVDEGLASLDNDSDGIPDACDSCPDLGNPGQSASPVCIGPAQGSGQCLAVQVELPNPIADGEITLVRDVPGAPAAIEFDLNVSSCGRIDPVEILLNGRLIASFTEPTDSCACVPPLYHVTAGDAGLLAQAWDPSGDNVITLRKVGAPSPPGTFLGTYVGWVRAVFESASGQPATSICLFDFDGGTCSQPDQCIGNATEDALDFSTSVTANLIVEETLASAHFSNSSLPSSIDVSAVPDGPMRLCVGAAGPPRLYAADASGGLYRIDTASGAATRDGDLPVGALEMAHDEITRGTWVQKAAQGQRQVALIDLISRHAIADSPYLGVPLEGMEFIHGRLYAVDTRSGGPRLMEINPETGASLLKLDLGDATWRGLAYDKFAGLFYSVGNDSGASSVRSLDIFSGVTRTLLDLEFEVSALEIGPDDALYATRAVASDTELYQLDLFAGEATLVGRLGVSDVVTLATVRHQPRGCADIVKQGQQSLALGGSCNAGPIADAGANLDAECSSTSGASVVLDGSGSSDPDSSPGTHDDIVGFEWSEDFGTATARLLGTGETVGVTLPLGTHQITLKVTDRIGETAIDVVVIHVVDTTPPILSASAAPSLLWPPNHRLVSVNAVVTASDDCGPASVQLVSASSTEADDDTSTGDGNTSNDIQGAVLGTADFDLLLRAERDSNGHGRIYSLKYQATDSSGNFSDASALALVPHDQAGITEPIQLSLNENSRGTVVEWSQVPGALYYNVIRGNVSDIGENTVGINLGTVVCIESASFDASTDGREDRQSPSPGSAFFYVVEYNDGWSSSYGEPSALKPRLIGSGGCQ